MIANGYRVSFGVDENVLKLLLWWLHDSVNQLKTIELYTLTRLIIWYVNYLNKVVNK